ncbi:MAG: MFS transporter, partial [Bacteroidota bacterium]
PHTPPKDKGKKVSVSDVLGLDALALLKERSFGVLFLASILICIPLMFYYSFTNPLLNEVGFENAAGKMTLGQMSELLFLLVMPVLFKRYGVKIMMLIGMLAWGARYVMFAYGAPDSMVWMLYAGIILHGICYDFFFVTGQIYADNKAPENLRSSVQGMMTFATYGVGMFIGSLVSGPIVDNYATSGGAVAHDWTSIWLIPAAFSVIVAILFFVLFKDSGTEEVTEEESIAGTQLAAD